MSKAILGTKLGMSQVFAENGDLVPVTVVEVLPNVVAGVKTVETDGYNAVQIGYGAVKEKHLTRPVKGQFEKAGINPVKYLREYRLAEKPEYTVGQTLAADIFAAGEFVDVIGISRGKGFAGTIKRWNHQRGPESHGSKIIARPHLWVRVCPAAAERCSKAKNAWTAGWRSRDSSEPGSGES